MRGAATELRLLVKSRPIDTPPENFRGRITDDALAPPAAEACRAADVEVLDRR